uniref:Uncharacterized protein n=1 Tax=Trichobilharzia regenti TaxID=157069 RepID=A0AA85JTL1_TRIRE|nr:unnamed protein product [Trichobilharzia regenti]
MQSLLNTFRSCNLRMFGMRFASSKCKMMLQNWTTATPSLEIESEVIEHVDHFTYLKSTISPNGLITDEISEWTQKAVSHMSVYAVCGVDRISGYRPKADVLPISPLRPL